MDETIQEAEKQNNNHKRKVMAAVVFTGVAVAGIIIFYFYLQYIHTHITTDDAFIDGDIHTIAPKVPGTVKAVLVKSNQFVTKGDALVEIDPLEYEVRVNEAEAGMNTEKAKHAERESTVESSKSMLSELSPKDSKAQCPLGSIIGWLHTRLIEKNPKRVDLPKNFSGQPASNILCAFKQPKQQHQLGIKIGPFLFTRRRMGTVA